MGSSRPQKQKRSPFRTIASCPFLKICTPAFSVPFHISHNMADILRKGTFYIHDYQVHNTRENPLQALSAAYMQLPEYPFLYVQPCRRQKVSRPEQAFGSSLSAVYCLSVGYSVKIRKKDHPHALWSMDLVHMDLILFDSEFFILFPNPQFGKVQTGQFRQSPPSPSLAISSALISSSAITLGRIRSNTVLLRT